MSPLRLMEAVKKISDQMARMHDKQANNGLSEVEQLDVHT